MSKMMENYFSTIKKVLPAPEAKPSVGLDIGTNSCKLVELGRKGNTQEILDFAISPVIQGNQKQAVRELLGKMKSPHPTVVTSVSGKGSLIRFIEMPRMTPEDLKRSFAIEADKYFPFPKDQIYMDSFILDPAGKDGKMSVLVAAAKKEMIEERIKLLGELGLQADFITLNSIAVANVFHVMGSKETAGQKSPAESAYFGVLDVGEMVSSFTILEQRIPRLMRDIYVGGRDFTKAISSARQLRLDEAEQLKLNPGSLSAEVLEACESSVMDLVSDLRLSIDYFVTEKNASLSRLLLTGGGASLPGFPEMVAKFLDMNVTLWNPWEGLGLGSFASETDLAAGQGRYGVAVGLALYA